MSRLITGLCAMSSLGLTVLVGAALHPNGHYYMIGGGITAALSAISALGVACYRSRRQVHWAEPEVSAQAAAAPLPEPAVEPPTA